MSWRESLTFALKPVAQSLASLTSSTTILVICYAWRLIWHGFASKWTFLCRTTPNISHLFNSLDYSINTTFLPVLTEQPQCNDILRELLSLPIRDGGLGIVEPSKVAESHYANSLTITAPLVSILTGNSSATVLDVHNEMLNAKSTVHLSNRERIRVYFDNIYQQLSAALKKCVDIARDRGASSWLSAMPIQKHGFALHK